MSRCELPKKGSSIGSPGKGGRQRSRYGTELDYRRKRDDAGRCQEDYLQDRRARIDGLECSARSAVTIGDITIGGYHE